MKAAISLAPPKKFLMVSVLTAVFALAALLAGVLALRYLGANWRILSEVQQELVNLGKRHAEISRAADALKRLQSEEELILSAFADEDNPLPFIESIESLGRRFGVKTELALVAAPTAEARQDYALEVSGTFPKVMSFFQNLESLPFGVEFGDVEMRRAEYIEPPRKGAKPETLVRLTLTIRPVRP